MQTRWNPLSPNASAAFGVPQYLGAKSKPERQSAVVIEPRKKASKNALVILVLQENVNKFPDILQSLPSE